MLEFQNTFSIADLINICLLITAGFGIFLTFCQIRASHKTQKATFFMELYSTMFSDRDIREIYYQIEYDEFVYDEKFHGSDSEKILDRLLSFADLVCDLYRQKIISNHEMSFFKYEFSRIYQNDNVQKYLKFLQSFYSRVNTRTEPFASHLYPQGARGLSLFGYGPLRLSAPPAEKHGRRNSPMIMAPRRKLAII